jgi:hypothetical protein
VILASPMAFYWALRGLLGRLYRYRRWLERLHAPELTGQALSDLVGVCHVIGLTQPPPSRPFDLGAGPPLYWRVASVAIIMGVVGGWVCMLVAHSSKPHVPALLLILCVLSQGVLWVSSLVRESAERRFDGWKRSVCSMTGDRSGTLNSPHSPT